MTSRSLFRYLFVAVVGGVSALALQSAILPTYFSQISAQKNDKFATNFLNNPQSAVSGSPISSSNSPISAEIPPLAVDVPLTSSTSTPSSPLSTAGLDDLRARLSEYFPEEQTAIELYATYNKSVVNVSTLETKTTLIYEQTAEGCGSGIVLNDSGVILTNFHVVENANQIEVTLFNGETYPARPIGLDPNTDVALLKIDAPKETLFPVKFGDSSKLLVGQTVYAIGNPFGLERTMTKGIVSNLNRTIGSPQQFRQIKGVVQIDAAINPGNSGGILLDSKGQMIGMNTAIASRVGENSGVGFAIPVNTIHRIATILIEKGEVVRGNAGIVQVTEIENGLIPGLIDEQGAADEAGLRGGKLKIVISERNGIRIQSRKIIRPEEGFDVIFGVNGQPVKTGEEFITLVEEHAPGETIVLNVLRNGQKIELPIVLK